jgi:hypothetical protein
LGGSLGLFTGIAIIMIFEVIELLWDILFNVWKHTTAGTDSTKLRFGRNEFSSSNFG